MLQLTHFLALAELVETKNKSMNFQKLLLLMSNLLVRLIHSLQRQTNMLKRKQL
jgi:hypothetical protein